MKINGGYKGRELQLNIYKYLDPLLFLLPEDCFNNMKLLVAMMYMYISIIYISKNRNITVS